MSRVIKVAVIGSGLAGLTAAHLLTQPCTENDVQFEVHLFEKNSTIGMDASSISLSAPGLEEWRIDVPMRSFQGGYYKQLIALYKSLGVHFRQADFSYSFSSLSPATKDFGRKITPTLIYNGRSGSAGIKKPSNDGKSGVSKSHIPGFIREVGSNVSFLCWAIQILFCYLLSIFHALPFRRPLSVPNVLTFQEWAARVKPKNPLLRFLGADMAWENYVQTILIPLFSAVCTAPREDILNHSVEEFLDYIWLTLGTHHYVVTNGVCDVISRLIVNVHHIHLSSTITSIRPDAPDSRLLSIQCSDGDYSGFRHVIFATQANGAVPLLSSYSQAIPSHLGQRKSIVEQQIQCLRTFQYRPSVVINHTDDSLLPNDAQCVRDLNLISATSSAPCTEHKMCVPSTYTMATHVIPRPLQYPCSHPTIFQTTNPITCIRQDSVISSATLERAIVTPESKHMLRLLSVAGERRWWQCPYESTTSLGPLQGARSHDDQDAPGIWMCGSYAHSGIPLLEGCVISARKVVEEGILRSEGLRWSQEPWKE